MVSPCPSSWHRLQLRCAIAPVSQHLRCRVPEALVLEKLSDDGRCILLRADGTKILKRNPGQFIKYTEIKKSPGHKLSEHLRVFGRSINAYLSYFTSLYLFHTCTPVQRPLGFGARP